MSFKLIASIRNLSLENLDFIATPLFTISCHQTYKEQMIDPNFIKVAGARAIQSFRENTIAFFSIENERDEDDFVAQMNIEFFTKAPQIETFLLFLWFVKDNSVSLEQVHGMFTVSQKFNWWSGNNIFSTSDGQFNPAVFSKNELIEATDFLLAYTEYCTSQTDIKAALSPVTANSTPLLAFSTGSVPYLEQNRIERALAFLKTARAVPHLPQKITHYMSILECLFSTDSNNIVKNISERVAYYLNDHSAKKIIRTAYDIRSRFVHGEKMKWDHAFISASATKTDEVIRRALRKIILSDHADFLQADMYEYLQRLRPRNTNNRS